jgi:hypothetical protein
MELGLSIMVLNLEYKFKNDCLRQTWVIKPDNLVFFWQIKDYNSRMKKRWKSKIKLGLPLMVPDLVYNSKWFVLGEIILLNRNRGQAKGHYSRMEKR